MSRTFRRKTVSNSTAIALGVFSKENQMVHFWKCWKEPQPVWEWTGHASYEEYKQKRLFDFHSDRCKYYCNYSSAPKKYRLVKECQFRMLHKGEMSKLRKFHVEDILADDYDIDLRPHIKDAGWDYW